MLDVIPSKLTITSNLLRRQTQSSNGGVIRTPINKKLFGPSHYTVKCPVHVICMDKMFLTIITHRRPSRIFHKDCGTSCTFQLFFLLDLQGHNTIVCACKHQQLEKNPSAYLKSVFIKTVSLEFEI